MKVYIGIDNGVTGSIGIIKENGEAQYIKTPVFEDQDYVETVRIIKRIDRKALNSLISKLMDGNKIRIVLERPFSNPIAYSTSLSAIRAFDSTISVLEDLSLGYDVIAPKQWQKIILPISKPIKKEIPPTNMTDSDTCKWMESEKKRLKAAKDRRKKELKEVSLIIGKKLFPLVDMTGFTDADGLLIAEYARRANGQI